MNRDISASGTPLVFRPRTVVWASLAAAAILVTAGSLTEVSLGDENPHVRQVRAFVEQGRRVPFDPAFEVEPLRGIRFVGTPVWYTGLAGLWSLTGTESQVLAQGYQAGFYLLLVLSVYFGVRSVWGPSAATWNWLLAASMPMVCVYSIVLYQDVPGIAVSALGFLLAWRKRFLAAGILFGLAYLTKLNMLSFAPWAVIFAAWWSGGTWKRRLAAGLCVAVPVLAAFTYDITWRIEAFGQAAHGDGLSQAFLSRAPDLSGLSAEAVAAIKSQPGDYQEWEPQRLTDPISVISHLGIPLLALMLVAPFRSRDTMSKWLWACFGFTLAGFLYVFCIMPLHPHPQIRYALPVILALLMLSGRGAARWRVPRPIKVLVVAVCCLQALCATAFISHLRRIGPHEQAAYAWIRRNTSPDARIMYPEQVLTNRTGRLFIWGDLNPSFFMTEATDQQRRELLRYFRVGYIAVPLRRTYDRAEEGSHTGGYARQFIDHAGAAPYLETVYENPGVLILEFTGLPGDESTGNSPRESTSSAGRAPAKNPRPNRP